MKRSLQYFLKGVCKSIADNASYILQAAFIGGSVLTITDIITARAKEQKELYNENKTE